MNELQIFRNSEFGEIRVSEINGQPWFCLSDICKILDLEQVSRVKERLNLDGVTTNKVIDNLGREQQANFINESNLYKVIFQSRKEEAEKFTEWVTSEVLPSIRKTGTYIAPTVDSKMLYQIAQALEEKEHQVQILSTENKLLSQQNLEWATRNTLNAIIKAYGAKVGFEEGWKDFKKELLYNHGININLRITNQMNDTGKKTKPATLTMIHDDEVSKCVSTAVALCKSKQIDISSILNKFTEQKGA